MKTNFLLLLLLLIATPVQACFVNNQVCGGGQNLFDLELEPTKMSNFSVVCSQGCVATVSIGTDSPSLITLSPTASIIGAEPVQVDVLAQSVEGDAKIIINFDCQSYIGTCQ